MAEFIFSLVLMVCLGAVLWIAVRALPRLEEIPGGTETKSPLERWAHSELPERIDAAMNGFFVKFLRRMKVMVLRMDNSIASGLRKVQHSENRANESIDFKEISGHNSEGKTEEKEEEQRENVHPEEKAVDGLVKE
jgi:hypothetical protein